MDKSPYSIIPFISICIISSPFVPTNHSSPFSFYLLHNTKHSSCQAQPQRTAPGPGGHSVAWTNNLKAELRSLEFALMKKLVSNVQYQSQLHWQYNHKVIHVFLSISNAAAPAGPGYITQLLGEVKTRAIKNGRKQPQNF